MHTISIFGLKGGTGRTTLTMALASALVAQGRRVLVVDATDRATSGRAYTLTAWATRQHEDGTARNALEALPLTADGDLEEALARAARRGIDIALIDTEAWPNAHHPVAADTADLVLVPFLNWVEAETVSRRLEHAGETAPIFGVEAGADRDELRRRRALRSFGGPTLRTALPRSDVFARMPGMGRLDRLVAALDDPEAAKGQAWVAAQELATEVLWLLQGFALKPAVSD